MMAICVFSGSSGHLEMTERKEDSEKWKATLTTSKTYHWPTKHGSKLTVCTSDGIRSTSFALSLFFSAWVVRVFRGLIDNHRRPISSPSVMAKRDKVSRLEKQDLWGLTPTYLGMGRNLLDVLVICHDIIVFGKGGFL